MPESPLLEYHVNHFNANQINNHLLHRSPFLCAQVVTQDFQIFISNLQFPIRCLRLVRILEESHNSSSRLHPPTVNYSTYLLIAATRAFISSALSICSYNFSCFGASSHKYSGVSPMSVFTFKSHLSKSKMSPSSFQTAHQRVNRCVP